MKQPICWLIEIGWRLRFMDIAQATGASSFRTSNYCAHAFRMFCHIQQGPGVVRVTMPQGGASSVPLGIVLCRFLGIHKSGHWEAHSKLEWQGCSDVKSCALLRLHYEC